MNRPLGGAEGFKPEGYTSVSPYLIVAGADRTMHVYVPDVDATYRKALDAGAESVQEPVKKEDDDKRCGVKDAGGVTWWIATRVAAPLLMLIAAGTVAHGQKPASLIRNGSFEEGPAPPAFVNLPGGSTAIPGWVVTGEGIDLVGAGYWLSSDGTYAIDLDGSARSRTTPPFAQGGIAQTFATTAGKRYVVTFDLAGNPMRGPARKPMRISAAGQTAEFTFDATGRTARAMGWGPETWTFTATADSTTLEFTSLMASGQTGYGAAIDRVAVALAEGEPLRITESEREIQVSLGAEILFDTGESTLRPAATASLEQLAALIREHPDLPVQIEGHTDSVGTRAFNRKLSLDRAESVKRWLVAQGSVPEGRLTTRGFGPEVPVAPNGTAEGRQANRRVEVRLRKQPSG